VLRDLKPGDDEDSVFLRDAAEAHIRELLAAAPQPTLESGEPQLIIRCRDCGGTQLWEKTAEGYETIHSCHDGKQVRDMVEAAEQRGAQEMAEKAAQHILSCRESGSMKNVVQVFDVLADQVRSLAGAAKPEPQVDTSDIPEITDWSKAERGKFYRNAAAPPPRASLPELAQEYLMRRDSRFHHESYMPECRAELIALLERVAASQPRASLSALASKWQQTCWSAMMSDAENRERRLAREECAKELLAALAEPEVKP